MKLLLFVASMVICASSYGQQVDCAKFASAIDRDLRTLSYGYTSHRPNDAVLASVAATNINSNLLIMQAAKCKLPNEPIADSYYMQNAFDCGTAESFGNKDDMLEKCARYNWVMKRK